MADNGKTILEKYSAIIAAALDAGLPWSEIEATISEAY
jgi:hypothetical protein